MAFSIVTDFIADATNGIPPSFVINFTDLTIVTDGFAREWFWDFGDGESSNEQNPSHTYEATGGETFTVRLQVLATVGEFDALVSSDINCPSAGSGSMEQNGFSLVGELESWEDFLLDTPIGASSQFAVHQLTRTGSTDRQYKNIYGQVSCHTAFDTGLHILTVSPSDFEIFQGTFVASLGGSLAPTNNDTRQLMGQVPGVTGATPVTIDVSVLPVGRLPDVETTNIQHGQNGSFGIRSFIVSSGQIWQGETKENYISAGTPPIAAFDATNRSGFSPLSVQFINQSTPAVGLPTTYSWKKRISGSGDSFVEFSTAENPLEVFIK